MTDQFQLAVGKGCLAGILLAAAFLLVGGLLYLAARSLGIEGGVSLVIGLTGGPVVVSAGVIGAFLVRGQRGDRASFSRTGDRDAAATRNDT